MLNNTKHKKQKKQTNNQPLETKHPNTNQSKNVTTKQTTVKSTPPNRINKAMQANKPNNHKPNNHKPPHHKITTVNRINKKPATQTK